MVDCGLILCYVVLEWLLIVDVIEKMSVGKINKCVLCECY